MAVGELNDERWEAHEKLHEQERSSQALALATASQIADAHDRAHTAEHAGHAKVHADEQLAVRTALANVDKERDTHATSHDKEHLAHTHVHENERKGVLTALDAVAREREIHAAAHEKEHQAHEKEHEGHEREHGLDKLAITKVEHSTETRFAGVNEFRGQLSDQAKTFATIAAVEAMRRESDRRMEDMSKNMLDRFEQNRQRIENLEKGDVKQEGKGVGQGALAGWIIAGVGLFATVLTIVIVLANVLTKP